MFSLWLQGLLGFPARPIGILSSTLEDAGSVHEELKRQECQAVRNVGIVKPLRNLKGLVLELPEAHQQEAAGAAGRRDMCKSQTFFCADENFGTGFAVPCKFNEILLCNSSVSFSHTVHCAGEPL